MLDTQTKRRIDSARDILVGKVPDPKSQVEMITMAMIYKFMDDMDNQAVEYGGNRSFFTGDYEKFAWTKLFDLKLSGQETLNLYADAISSFAFNPNLPQLFRDIFKNAYLPFRDPQTLKLFLKTINDFHYDHSEKLGDAFEYLLSVLGSQGDAGQFRTPRHIIDFMVEILDPKKGDTIADPACGTAGFLISSYKHILKQNTKNSLGDLLTPDERTKLMTQFTGYDISPDMVRLSLVNMYLHGFPNPNIQEYDTLTSEEKWDEYFDIILANPPFMTPKGGIRPHNRFSVQANKAEVLFTDYIAEHINPVSGKAAIVVPNGIVATTNKAYKELRKLLVNESLLAVISLPAGVFQPYSGVKTSVLILDKRLAKKTDKILFLKINNDGFDLGAQRRPIDKNDLPKALETIQHYRDSISKGEEYILDWENISLTEKTRILESNDISLSAERYFEKGRIQNEKFPIVAIMEVCNFRRGSTITKKQTVAGNIPVIAGGQQPAYYHNEANRNPNTITVSSSGAYSGFVGFHSYPIFASDCFTIEPKNEEEVNIKFLFHLLKARQEQIYDFQEGGGQPHVYPKHFEDFEIPLPPLEIQKEIVAEIEGYQKIIDGAKQVVENYKPTIKINPDWEMVELGEVCEFKRGPFGGSLKKEIFVKDGYLVYEQYHPINNDFSFGRYFITEKKFNEMKSFAVDANEILISCSGTMGKIAVIPEKFRLGIINQALLKLKCDKTATTPYFIKYYLETEKIQAKYFRDQAGAAIQNVMSVKELKKIPFPKIDLNFQIEMISQIEEEQKLVDANKKLIEIFEQKIKDRIDEVWGVSQN